jgi:hypothetical protein
MNQSVTIDMNKAAEVGATSPAKVWQMRLGILLVVQLLLTIGLFAYKKIAQPSIAAQPLLGFSSTEIDRILISDANNSAELKKVDSTWLLPGVQQLPVDQEKLSDVLQKLDGIKLTWPVTTTRSAHERFEVTATQFQRRIELFQGDSKKADLFLGTSPGFKKVHLRLAEADEVYAIELSAFEFPAAANDWLQKDLLALDDIEMIKGPDYQLLKQGDDWRFVAEGKINAEENVAREKITQLSNALGSLQIQEPAAQAPQAQQESQQSDTTLLTVKAAAGEFGFEFIKVTDNYFVKRSDKDVYFKLSQYEYERITQLNKASLTEVAAEVSATASTAENVTDSATAKVSDVSGIAEAALRDSGLKTDSN